MSNVINVANRLPVTVGEKIKKSAGGLVSAMEGVQGEFDLQWVGWPGSVFKDKKRETAIEKQLKEEYNFSPVFLTRSELDNYYYGFSNSSLWPLLHYMSNYVRHENHWWQAYEKVNRKYLDVLEKTVKGSEIIWVHDYHLMLLPDLLRQRYPKARIGFFLHTPFPSYEVFRCHPRREELLTGLLGADLVGFHTFGHMRHFRSSVMRLLGVESEVDGIHINGRRCQLGVFPIGCNAKAFLEQIATDEHHKKKQELAKTYEGKKIVLSVERLDYTKGLLRRLSAIDQYLAQCKNREEIVFIFVSVPSRGEVKEYEELRNQVESQVGRINGKYTTVSNVPVHFIHKSQNFPTLCALYSLADVAMVTPLMDGMNLVCKEYIACKPDGAGVLMLSEFAGAAEELFNAVKVNPYDIENMVQVLKHCLNMSEKEKKRHMDGMHKHVTEFDNQNWAKTFLGDLHKVNPEQINQEFELDPLKAATEHLSVKGKIALFLDYDGSLREFQPMPEQAFPTPGLRVIFEKLSKLHDVSTFIISGRNEEVLQEWMGMYPFTLVAEHGFRYRKANTKKWTDFDRAVDLSWKPTVIEICEKFVATTPGSFIEPKISSIVWHYRRSDPEFGNWKAHQLMETLRNILVNVPVEVHHGKKIVEVSSSQINKGIVVNKLITANSFKAAICAGDDQTDESMFRVEDKRLLHIKIGPGETRANCRVASPTEFRYLLKALASKLAKKDKK